MFGRFLPTAVMKREFELFKRIWIKKRSDLSQWMFYNVLLGLAPIWLLCFPFILGGRPGKLLDPFCNGATLIFAATLTGASLSFFAEELQRGLKSTKQFLWNSLILILILSSAAYTAIISLLEFSPNNFIPWITVSLSIFLLLAGIILNLHLAAVRLAYGDSEFIKELFSAEPTRLANEANDATEDGGVKL